jgi:starch phosphorylase
MDLWEAHQRQKLELMIFARNRLRHQFARHGESPGTLEELEDVLDVGALTIGFARRFATYKRAGLLFSDMDRISTAALGQGPAGPDHLRRQGPPGRPARPGRHPGDLRPVALAQLRGRVFILEDYDMRVARFMVQGVDVWLNNPRAARWRHRARAA